MLCDSPNENCVVTQTLKDSDQTGNLTNYNVIALVFPEDHCIFRRSTYWAPQAATPALTVFLTKIIN